MSTHLTPVELPLLLRRGAQAAGRRQRGTTLLEALVSLLVLTLGMLSVGRIQTQLRLNTELARQRGEAVRLAQEDLERLRAFVSLTPRGTSPSYAGIASLHTAANANPAAGSATRFEIDRQVLSPSGLQAKAATVTVAWADRRGDTHQVVLDTFIAGQDPAHSGALALLAVAPAADTVYARSPLVPVQAGNLGNGSSAFKPQGLGNWVLVMDNTSGAVTQRCTVADPNRNSQSLRVADLSNCQSQAGHLISGLVRFSATVPADVNAAGDTPLSLNMVAQTTAGGNAAPWCTSDDMKVVRLDTPNGPRNEAVPQAATPALLGASAWTETPARHVAYHCVVPPSAAAPSVWSGRLDVQPQGWTLGTGAEQWQVCRYVADLDGNGRIDRNAEHPASYTAVDGALPGQNFLVVRGPQNCPSASLIGMALNLTTAAHQP
jgi:Tfp pilus assembly protein PilV